MAVFEDKFRPDMEVCKSLQFYSFKYFSSCVQIDCWFLQSLCSTIVSWNALWHRYYLCGEDRLLGKASFWSGPAVPSLGLEEPAQFGSLLWPLGCLGNFLAVNAAALWNVFMCTKLSVPRYLKMTGCFFVVVFSLRIEKRCMSLHVTQSWPENGGSFKNPCRLLCIWQQKMGTRLCVLWTVLSGRTLVSPIHL